MSSSSEAAGNSFEAERKYEKYKQVDPFPSIDPSLLNSADIADYIEATGMVHPFNPKDLKSASYTARIKGRIAWWNTDGEFLGTVLKNEKDSFTLKSDAIAFIEVEPYFRLPDYIAVRFNLTISNVYRGLLLGTGPLVDPGFEGKIFIPLHNLTTNDYVFKFDDKLIWIEFTKTSSIRKHGSATRRLKGDLEKRQGIYRSFPAKKKGKDLDYYFLHAAPHMEIRSSIPEAIATAKTRAEEAEKSAKLARNWSIGLVVTSILAITSMLISVWMAFQSYNDKVDEIRIGLPELVHKTEELQKLIDAQGEQIRATADVQNDRIQALETAVSETEDGDPVE